MKTARKILHQKYSMDEILELANKNKSKLIARANNNYRKSILQVAERIEKNIENKKFLLICGPSSSGKTTTSNLIMQVLSYKGISSLVVSMDNFFVNREETPKLPNGDYDFDNVTALNLDLFKNCMDKLLKTHTANLPVFDFITGKRFDNACVSTIDEKTIIIVEGIHAFNPLCISEDMQERSIKLFVAPQSDFEIGGGEILSAQQLRFRRRLIRDFHSRGYDVQTTENNWQNVIVSEEKFIKPFRGSADCVIDTTYSYEPILYNDELRNIGKEDANAERYIIDRIPTTSLTKRDIPKNVLIWEFLGA